MFFNPEKVRAEYKLYTENVLDILLQVTGNVNGKRGGKNHFALSDSGAWLWCKKIGGRAEVVKQKRFADFVASGAQYD